MRQIDARLAAGRGIAVKDEGLAVAQVGAAAGERAEPELRPLQVDEDADRAAGLFLHLADHRDPLPHPVMRSVAHVDAKDVGAGGEQGGDGLAVGRSGAERGDDFDAAATDLQLRSSDNRRRSPPRSFFASPERRADVVRLKGVAWSVSCTVQLLVSLPVSTSKKPVRLKPRIKQSCRPSILNSRSDVHMNTLPFHSPPRSSIA